MKLIFSRKVDPYLQLLGTLYLLLRQIRLKGLLSIEDYVENPRDSKLFNIIAPYDQANETVYTFICDVLRLMVGGNLDSIDMQRYMDAYRKTTTLSDEQAALLECARLTLIAAVNGYAPQIAIEHGRQGVPAELKPSFQELEDFIRSVTNSLEPAVENVEDSLKNFYVSIGAAGGDEHRQ